MDEDNKVFDVMGVKVNLVIKVMGILCYLVYFQVFEGVNVIVCQVGINLSLCFNILKMLVYEDFVCFDKEIKMYLLGVVVIDFVVLVFDFDVGFLCMWLIFECFVCENGVICGFWCCQGDCLILFGIVESEVFVWICFMLGNCLLMYIGVMGCCIIVCLGMDEVEIDKVIISLKWVSMLKLSYYFVEVCVVGVEGYVIDDGNFFQGVILIVVLVISCEGVIMYCVVVIIFKGYFDFVVFLCFGQVVKKVVEKVMLLLWSVCQVFNVMFFCGVLVMVLWFLLSVCVCLFFFFQGCCVWRENDGCEFLEDG